MELSGVLEAIFGPPFSPFCKDWHYSKTLETLCDILILLPKQRKICLAGNRCRKFKEYRHSFSFLVRYLIDDVEIFLK